MDERLQGVIDTLIDVSEDSTVPRNVKSLLQQIIEALQNEEEDLDIRKDKALSLLDEVAEDSNLQPYTRTQIWNVVSVLEMLQ
jgi:uncharacterized protein